MIMNVRIMELAKECREVIEHRCFEGGGLFHTTFDEVKFTQLIVEECIEHIHKRNIRDFGMLEELKLREHFGTEK